MCVCARARARMCIGWNSMLFALFVILEGCLEEEVFVYLFVFQIDRHPWWAV